MTFKLSVKLVSIATLGAFLSLSSLTAESTRLYVTPSKDYHIVQKGESIESISQKYSIALDDLRTYNQLGDEHLFVGQKIWFIPPKNEHRSYYVTRVSIPRSGFHVVDEGQDLEWISQRYNVEVLDLIEYNRLANLQLTGGQKIWLETGHIETVTETPEYLERVKPTLIPMDIPAPAVASSDTIAFEPYDNIPLYELQLPDTTANVANMRNVITDKIISPTKSIPPQYHVVKRGETLSKIAKNYRTTVSTIKKLNRMKSTKLKPGQRLLIRKGIEVEPEEHIVAPNGFVMPVNGKPVSEFGWRGRRPHKGIDLSAPTGEPIYAALDGKVVFVGRQRGYGNVVILEHADSVMTVYAHNDANLVRINDTVTAGQPIATVGHTGNATCSHLHFEYRIKGKAVNPRGVLPLGIAR